MTTDIRDIANEMARDLSGGEQIVDRIVTVTLGDISNEDPNLPDLVDTLAYSPYRNVDLSGVSLKGAEKMPAAERGTGSMTVLERMRSKLAKSLVGRRLTENEMKTEMHQFISSIKTELLTTENNAETDNRDTVSNPDIQTFLKTNLGVNVKRGDIRPCVTMKVGDAQQMIDMWGRGVTEYAKGMGRRDEETGRCYLCGLHIVPFGSCPEMEHKYPATTAYTNMHHYRLLQVYKGQPLTDGSADSMYTLWKRFVSNNSNLDVLKTLKTLYNNINHDLPYNRHDVDTQYHSIFTNFWETTMYAGNANPYRLSSDELENVRLFFFNFIKAWLMEFAYSHHICNQAKSDLNIWGNERDRNIFIRDARKRLLKSTKDKKAEMENTTTQGKIKLGIVERADRTNNMFEHLNEVVTDYTDAYGRISHSVGVINSIKGNSVLNPGDGNTTFKNHAIDNAYKVSEAMIMLKALYYISKSDDSGSSSSVSSSKESAKESAEESAKEKDKKAIQDKYTKVLNLEETFVGERKSKRQQDNAFMELNDMVENYRTTYGEEPLSECVFECINKKSSSSSSEMQHTPLPPTPSPKKVKYEKKGGTRRRPRSKRRRVSKKKKTRKRRARKMVSKRRKKV